MKLLKYISDKPRPKIAETRSASRAVLFDENGLVPILFVSNFNYHKIPDGGTEKGETKMKGLIREIKEETGCEVKIRGEIGKVIEYRSKWNILQTSYGYIGDIIKKGEPSFTEDEIREGFKLVWLKLEEAVSQLRKDKPMDYQGKFIQERDLSFLEEVKEKGL